jgi:CRP/FNR family transcriptional regulator, cyclic AMP receptor protein
VAILRAKVNEGTLRMLEKVPIFSMLSERQLRGLAKDALERSYAEGAEVVKQGDKGVAFYLLLDGRVEVRRKGRRLATLGPGHFFGEMALFDNEPRTADVIATAPTRCLVLSKWEFWGFAMSEPRMLRGMLEEMARRLGATDRALSE